LNELIKQLRNLHALGHDRHMRLRHAGHIISCEKGRVCLQGAVFLQGVGKTGC